MITPPEMAFEVASPLPERMHPGLIILHRVRPLFGLPLTWVTEITQLLEGELFVDEQRFGPYRFLAPPATTSARSRAASRSATSCTTRCRSGRSATC